MKKYKNIYYSYQQSPDNLTTKPYTYLIKYKETGQVYYGVRYCYGADPNKFMYTKYLI